MKKLILSAGSALVLLYACNNARPSDSPLKVESVVNNYDTNNQKNKNNMKGFKTNIEKETLENNNFRKVIYTAAHLQLVLMSLKVGEEIGEEVHPNIDQFFRFESGNGKVIINNTTYEVTASDVIIVPAGAKHNVINTDANKALKVYTIYSPPNHEDALIRATKKEADGKGVKFNGKTTE